MLNTDKAKLRPPCSFKFCERPATTHGLCHAHTMQRYRGRELKPIRERFEGPKVKLPGVLVSERAVKKLRMVDESVYRAVRKVIEEWAQEAA